MKTKDKQINLRVSKTEKEKIKEKAKNLNYSFISEYIIHASLNKINNRSTNSRVIYTLTLNPAIDYIISTKSELKEITNFNPNEKTFEAGGKGINASIIMEEYGVKNSAIHYSGGFTGDLISNQLSEKGINHIQVKSKEDTRINLKLNFKDDNYEINSSATPLTIKARNAILKIISGFKSGDVLMIMGSYHEDDSDFIHSISEIVKSKSVELVYDLSKPILKDLLKYEPLIIKPNKEELEQIFKIKINSNDEIIAKMKELKSMGAKNVAVTMGKDGSYILDENNDLFLATIKPIKLISPQGSGDSFISSFVVKYNEGIKEAFKWANAAGTATAQVKDLANFNLIKESINNVTSKKI